MSITNPTKKEITDYFKAFLKDYFKHLKHLLKFQWHYKNAKYYCVVCSNKAKKRWDRERKNSEDRDKRWLQDDYKNLLRNNHPIESISNYYVAKQLEPVIKNLWLYKPIRDLYKQVKKDDKNNLCDTYALIKCKCGHRVIKKVLYYTHHRQSFIDELKKIRNCKCDNCIAKENKHILLRWYEWKLTKYNYYMYRHLKLFKHLGHILLNAYHPHCTLCLQFREKSVKIRKNF